MKKLFAPEHACKGLALHQPRIGIGNGTLQSGIKLIRLGAAAGEDVIKIGERLAGGAAASWPAVAVGRWSWRDRLALVTVPVRVLERQPEAPTAKACLPAATIDAFAGAGDFSPRGVERNVRSLREFLDA